MRCCIMRGYGLKKVSLEAKELKTMQVRRLFKTGGSVCVVLPRQYLKNMGLTVGSYVRFTMTKEWDLLLEKVPEGEEKEGSSLER